jgi:hypothetical protein
MTAEIDPDECKVTVCRCEKCPEIHFTVTGPDGDTIFTWALYDTEWEQLIADYRRMASGADLQ